MTSKIVSNAMTFPDLANVIFKFPGISKDPIMTTNLQPAEGHSLRSLEMRECIQSNE